MSAHTPGPWFAVKPTEEVTAKQDGWFIVDRADEMGHNVLYGLPDDVLEANAHLMAAAPELLDAARQMIAALDETKYDVFIGSPSDLLRLTDGRRALIDAVAKAEGR
jgi:ABC-type amino acid transport substrate-binding protein